MPKGKEAAAENRNLVAFKLTTANMQRAPKPAEYFRIAVDLEKTRIALADAKVKESKAELARSAVEQARDAAQAQTAQLKVRNEELVRINDSLQNRIKEAGARSE
jgi:hypothetical protein